MGQRNAHRLIVASAMQIDIAALGIAVTTAIDPRLLATEPQDAGQNPVPLRVGGGQFGGPQLTGRAPANEHRPRRQAIADACTHPMPPPGSAATAIQLTRPVLRCGYRPGTHLPTGLI